MIVGQKSLLFCFPSWQHKEMVIKKKKYYSLSLPSAATLALTAVIIAAPLDITPNMTTPAAATTTPSPVTARTDNESGIYQTQEKLVSQVPINQTHAEFVVSTNGTLTLPNGTETIRTTSTKSGIVSMMDGTFSGKEVLTTEDGTENATATIYEIIRFNMEAGTGTGIAMALFHTNSTKLLAPLDGMILTGRGELYTDETGLHSLWKWQSGIP